MEIPDFPNYLIHDDGRVESLNGKGLFLKPTSDCWEYHRVFLCKDGKKKAMSVHRLVAKAYIYNPENKPEVDHIDRDRVNNHVSNLRWVTRSENNLNKGVQRNNKCGHKNICKCKGREYWRFNKTIRGIKDQKYFKTLTQALCYKFIFILKNPSSR